jgi:hypothetical protein
MNNVIIYTNDAGGVSMCVPTGELPIEDVQRRDIPEGKLSFIVSRSDIPYDDMDFFNAWEQTRGTITVNVTKAREITKARLRSEREPLLAAQDVAFQRALESGADTTAIVAEKTRLRNVTSLADSATTLVELRAITVA